MAESERKNFRFSKETIEKLDELKNVTGINYTQLIESGVNYLHGEYKRALRGMQYDEVMIEQILGGIVKKLMKSS